MDNMWAMFSGPSLARNLNLNVITFCDKQCNLNTLHWYKTLLLIYVVFISFI